MIWKIIPKLAWVSKHRAKPMRTGKICNEIYSLPEKTKFGKREVVKKREE